MYNGWIDTWLCGCIDRCIERYSEIYIDESMYGGTDEQIDE